MATKALEYIWITLNDINEKYGIQEGYILVQQITRNKRTN